jgi:DNA polymerase I
MTVRADEGANDRHGANPIEKPNSPSHDVDDAHDDEMQQGSKLSSVVIQEASPKPVSGAKADYELINDQTRLGEMIGDIEMSASIGLDLETTGLRWWEDKIRILSITTQSGRTWLVDVFKVDIRLLLPALENTKIIAHNAQFDLLFLRRAGFEPGECSCTMILSQILWAGQNADQKFHGLQTLAKRVLGRTLDKDEQTADWSEDLSPEMLNYAAEDSRVLLPLYEKLVRLVKEAGGMERVVELEERLLKAVVSMTDAGVPIDREAWSEYVELVRREKERLIREMDSHVTESLPEEHRERNAKNKQIPQDRKEKLNWQSSKQRTWVLEGLGFILPLTENGNPSSGKDALKSIDHPLARLMERFNAIRNAAKTFGEALTDRAEGDRLHCDWRQNEATTGRMSCRKPPLQGVPSAGS